MLLYIGKNNRTFNSAFILPPTKVIKNWKSEKVYLKFMNENYKLQV